MHLIPIFKTRTACKDDVMYRGSLILYPRHDVCKNVIIDLLRQR